MSENDATGLLEQHLISRYDGEHVLFFPRASTGLLVLFQAIRKIRGAGEVIIPAMCCESVAMAVLYAGLTPRFGDVDPETLCLCPAWTMKNVGRETRAIVIVGLFGQPVEPDLFLALPERDDIVLIDDLAQSVGGRIASEEIGARFDVTLLSFADDKVIGGEGGALVLRGQIKEEDLNPYIRDLPPGPSPNVLAEKALGLRNLCHSLYEKARSDTSMEIHVVFGAGLPQYQELLNRQGPLVAAEYILKQFEELEETRVRRIAKYDAYVSEISTPLVTPVRLPEGANCWRCSVLCTTQEVALELTKTLRLEGIHASNHYFSLGRLFYGEALKQTDDVSSRIINLWVNDATDEREIEKTVSIINHFN